MANWNLPTATSGYLDFVTEMNSKFVDAATLQYGSGIVNLPENTIRFARNINIFQEWVAGAWQNKVLSIAGGGTGSSTQAGIIANLGLGSMSTQNSNAVNITGGSISGVNLDAGSITGGIVALSRGGTGASLVLPPYGYILVSNGSSMVTDSGISILQINAARIVGTIPDANLSSNVATLNGASVTFTNYVQFTASGIYSPTINSGQPALNFCEGDQPPNQRYVRIILENHQLLFQSVTDDFSLATTWFVINTSGIGSGNSTSPFNGVIYGNGVGVTNLNANYISNGTVPIAALGAGGSRDSSTFLRGDNIWAVPAGGSGGGTPIPTGMIAMFDTNCPAGWTRFSQMDGRFPGGGTSPGTTGGSGSHSHNFTGNTDGGGSHSHGFSGSGGLSGARAGGHANGTTSGGSGSVQTADAGGSFQVLTPPHTHGFGVDIDIPVSGGSVSISGSTDGVGNHTHTFGGGTDVQSNYPPHYILIFCRKD